MQSGNALASRVAVPSAQVSIGSTVVTPESVSFSRSIGSDLPPQVTGGGGLAGATGSLSLLTGAPVEKRALTPWRREGSMPPVPADPVTVKMGYGADLSTQLVGRVEDVTGDWARKLDVSILDTFTDFNVPFSMDALMDYMPPYAEGGPYRPIGLQAEYVVDKCFRAAGKYVTPKIPANCRLSAPLQGSVWPEVGYLTDSTTMTVNDVAHAKFAAGPDRLEAHNFSLAYAPLNGHDASAPSQVTWVVGASHTGSCNIKLLFGAATDGLRVGIYASTIIVFIHETAVLTVTAPASAYTVGQVILNGKVVTVKTDGGHTGTYTASSTGLSGKLASIPITGTDTVAISGVQVSSPAPADEFAAVNTFTPSARIRQGAVTGILNAIPGIYSTTAAEVLKQASQALCVGLWIDELGVAQWCHADVLRNQAPVATVYAKYILAVTWESSLTAVRSRVDVQWQRPGIKKSQTPSVYLVQGGGETTASPDTWDEWMKAGSNEDWVMPDRGFRYTNQLTSSAQLIRFNQGLSSWAGAMYIQSDGTEGDTRIPTSQYTIRPEWVTANSCLIKHTLDNSSADTSQNAALVTPDEGTTSGIAKRFYKEKLPLLRGYGRVRWNPDTVTSPTTGPAGAEAYAHDAGWWLQDRPTGTDAPLVFANYLAGQITKPSPTLTNVEIIPDFRLQLGDVITLSDPNISGLTITGVIFKIDGSIKTADATMSLGLRITNVTVTTGTLAELDAAWATETLAQFDTFWSNKTLKVLDTTPLLHP